MSVSRALGCGLAKLPAAFAHVRVPIVAAPMFLVSGPELVKASSRAGIIGTFPALNQRTSEGFEAWLQEIEDDRAEAAESGGHELPPYGVNLIVHRSNPRVQPDLDLIVKHKVPLVITSLGAVSDLVDAVHSYGGVVWHDIINVRHAEKAVEAGVDGLIPVCAGAGGHSGQLSPFALIPEIRKFFDGSIALAGCMGSGNQVAAALAMGADFAYMGTRFIATKESRAQEEYKQMIVDDTATDIIYTPEVSGVPATFLRNSLVRAGLDPDNLPKKTNIDFGEELQADSKAWRDIWGAGQGVGSIDDVPSVEELVSRIEAEFHATTSYLSDTSSTLSQYPRGGSK